MDVAVDHFIREWGGVSNALRAAERNLEFWRARGNRGLTKRYEEVIAYLEERVIQLNPKVEKNDGNSIRVSGKRRVSKKKRESSDQ